MQFGLNPASLNQGHSGAAAPLRTYRKWSPLFCPRPEPRLLPVKRRGSCGHIAEWFVGGVVWWGRRFEKACVHRFSATRPILYKRWLASSRLHQSARKRSQARFPAQLAAVYMFGTLEDRRMCWARCVSTEGAIDGFPHINRLQLTLKPAELRRRCALLREPARRHPTAEIDREIQKAARCASKAEASRATAEFRLAMLVE